MARARPRERAELADFDSGGARQEAGKGNSQSIDIKILLLFIQTGWRLSCGRAHWPRRPLLLESEQSPILAGA